MTLPTTPPFHPDATPPTVESTQPDSLVLAMELAAVATVHLGSLRLDKAHAAAAVAGAHALVAIAAALTPTRLG